MARTLYFDEFRITHKLNNEYGFTAKSKPGYGESNSIRAEIIELEEVERSRELKFNITEDEKGQFYELTQVDFEKYSYYDHLHMVLVKQQGATLNRDSKGQFVIRHTKYPPPDSQGIVAPKRMSEIVGCEDGISFRFKVIEIAGNRMGDGIYALTFKLRDDAVVAEYVAADYRVLYNDDNRVNTLVLFIEKPLEATQATHDLEFKPAADRKKEFDLNKPLPVVIMEKPQNYLEIDWTKVCKKIASISLD